MSKFNISINIESKEPIYFQIFNFFKLAIENAIFTENEKLPSTAQVAIKLNVSKLTVLKAYSLLENSNFVYKQKGIGVFVRKKEFIYNSENTSTLLDNFKFGQNKFEKMINFSSGTPDEELYPFQNFKVALNTVINRDGSIIMTYHSTQGYLKLRENIVKNLNFRFHVKNVQITSGTQQGLDLILKTLITPRNNKIIVGNPTYHGALNTFQNLGKTITVTLENDGFNMFELEKILSSEKISFIYVMINFCCPTGISWSKEKIKKLIELATKYNVYIIEDDCLSPISYYNRNMPILKELDLNNKYVIYIKSYSKILMPGLRLAYMLLPDILSEKIISTKFVSDVSSAGLEQRILNEFIENNWLEEHLSFLQKEYFERYIFFKEQLSEIKELALENDVEGGFLLWIKLSDSYDGNIFYNKCREKNVAILPGTLFYFNTNDFQHFRFSFAMTKKNEIFEGFQRIKKILKEMTKQS